MKKLLTIIILSFMSISVQASGAEAVRGVWLTNVDSDALNSRENIKKTVELCAETGINTIFVVTWNKAMTTYPSKIMKNFTGVEIDTLFTGRDPLKELIEEAHKREIKVFAWFEFGFSSSYEEKGGVLLRKKPEWASKDKNGALVIKNGFEWLNGFHPDVQDFLISLILEVVNNYDIDGIQGDDRLPAMPSEAGYDSFTVAEYQKDHNGEEPPEYSKDFEWVEWRAGRMTGFMRRIYEEVKSADPDMIISMAPSLYPWSKEEYLQDWPVWMAKGYVDLIIPQVYRYDIDAYEKELKLILDEQLDEKDFNKFYPGILLKVGGYYPDLTFMAKMIEVNRKNGIQGEVYFFYEGLKKYPDFFEEIYLNKNIRFPKLIKK